MAIRIEKYFTSAIPFDVEALVRELLKKVPKDHLVGLDAIIIVDNVTHKKASESGGLYWQKQGQELARIEIGVDAVYKGVPRVALYLPFVAKFMLANVLYHELGHHYQQAVHGIGKKSGEVFAEKYRKELINKAFYWWLIVFVPFSPLIHWLARIANKKRSP